ncbi:MAG TPA: hypothetical protein VMW47_02130 [Verrucomicrobiae bacterium]|nr:hypothetical protein [Verrucomicrobiae bacterium]
MTGFTLLPGGRDRDGTVADAVARCTRRPCRSRLAYRGSVPAGAEAARAIFVDLDATLLCQAAGWTRTAADNDLRQERRRRRRLAGERAAALGHDLGPWEPADWLNYSGFTFVRTCRHCWMRLPAHLHPFETAWDGAADDLGSQLVTSTRCLTIQPSLFVPPRFSEWPPAAQAAPTGERAPITPPATAAGQGRLFD